MLRTWTPDLSLGDEVIDAQHRELFDRMAMLGDALARGEGRQRIGELITFMSGYTLHHFREEELLMSGAGYPLLEAHKRMHAEFLKEVRQVREQHRHGQAKATLTIDFYRRVSDWLVNHICGADKAFARWRAEAARPPPQSTPAPRGDAKG